MPETYRPRVQKRLFLLDKNFEDLEKILRYIHAFAVRINKNKRRDGERLDTESWGTNVAWGADPFLDFSDYSPIHVLVAINGGYSFASTQGIEECARARGGSSYWANYHLTDEDYARFILALAPGI